VGLPALFGKIIGNYRRHAWQLRRVLLREETRAILEEDDEVIFKDATIEGAEIDALWFARPSQAGREAWELRLVTETPYALFETFEADEADEDREDVRREMEARMREYAGRS
jgi:hypothetical protein